MLINKIEQIKKYQKYNDDSLFLIDSINKDSGFFLYKNKMLYLVKSFDSDEGESIETECISLRTKVPINAVENHPTFETGNYNLLIYNGDYTSMQAQTFVDLCSAYSNSECSMSFTQFFYSVMDLFSMPTDKAYKDIIGTFGELTLIREMYEKYNINLSGNWHIKSAYDKYDFSFEDFNIEVKTTPVEERIFKIKHKQIFNDRNNYIVVINVNKDSSGETVLDVINYFKTKAPFANNLQFQLKLVAEENKLNPNLLDRDSFALKAINTYECKSLETITSIPDCITDVEYKYDFINAESIEIINLF